MAIRSTMWPSFDTSNWVNPADFNYSGYGQAGTVPYPGNPEAFDYDPETVGGGVAKYYGTVLSSLPTFEGIARNIKGVLSPETKRTIAQAAAERGIGIGSYGGGNDQTALLRALGLTSQQLTNQGIQQYQAGMQATPQLSPANLFISPFQREQMNLNWMTSQAQLANALQRARMAEEGATERAGIQQQTAFGTTRMNLASQENLAAQQAAAARAYNEQYLARADAAARAQQEANALARQYGIGMQGYDPWGGGVETPGNVLNPSIQATSPGSYFGMNVNPTYGEDFIGPPAPGYTGSTGASYFGEQFASPAEEYAYMQELGPGGTYFTPQDISVQPGMEWQYEGYWLD